MTYPIPPFSPQSSPTTGTDIWDCSNEAFIGCVEMLQNNFQQFSVRANAKMTGTIPGVGNAIEQVVGLTNEKGLISYTAWPDLPVFNASQYLAPISPAILKVANKSMQFSLVAPDLNISPIIMRLKMGNTFHFVITADNVNYIDSYAPQIKPIIWSNVVNKWSLTIKQTNMQFGYKTATDDTVYIQVGNALVPLTDWQAFLNLGGNAGSVVIITQEQLDSMPVITSDYFKSK